MAAHYTARGKHPDPRTQTARRRSMVAVAAMAATLTACSGNPAEQLETGALAPQQARDAKGAASPQTSADPKSATNLAALKAKHQAAPGDPSAAIAYASALKNAGQTKQARDVAAAAHTTATTNTELAGVLGLLELELGQPAKAQKLLLVAAAVANSDWRYNSGLGVALAVQGKHSDARDQFQKALAKSPANKTVLNNLAMTYMMDKKIDQAEGLLRQAKTGDGVPDAVGKNLELAARLRQPAAPGERRADTDAVSSKASKATAAN